MESLQVRKMSNKPNPFGAWDVTIVVSEQRL
jgi:hypothetical protein